MKQVKPEMGQTRKGLSLLHLPEFQRRNACELFKNPLKISDAFKAAALGNIGYIGIGAIEKGLCVINPLDIDIVCEFHSGGLIKDIAQVSAAYINAVCNGLQVKRFNEVVFDIKDRLIDFFMLF